MSRYVVKPSDNSSHSAILRLLGQGDGRRLLDVGCAAGVMSRRFMDGGWRVTGVEPFFDDARDARERGVEVLQMPVEQALQVIDGPFDAVVLADVLEHCVDPWALLPRIVEACAPSARVIISLPNIAHVTVRGQLLAGRFDYADRGILDRTHLRFFSLTTAKRLIAESGLICHQTVFTPAPVELVFPSLNDSTWGRGLLALSAAMAKKVPRLLAYQFVMDCSVR